MTGEHVYYAHLVHDRTGTEASEVWRETAHGKSRIIPALSPAQAGTVAAALNTAFAAGRARGEELERAELPPEVARELDTPLA